MQGEVKCLLYLAVLRLSDRMEVACFTAPSLRPEVIETVLQMLKEAHLEPRSKQVIELENGEGILYLSSEDVEIVAAITAPSYPRRLVFELLQEVHVCIVRHSLDEQILSATSDQPFNQMGSYILEMALRVNDGSSLDIEPSPVPQQTEETSKAEPNDAVRVSLDISADTSRSLDDNLKQVAIDMQTLQSKAPEFQMHAGQSDLNCMHNTRARVFVASIVATVLVYIFIPVMLHVGRS